MQCVYVNRFFFGMRVQLFLLFPGQSHREPGRKAFYSLVKSLYIIVVIKIGKIVAGCQIVSPLAVFHTFWAGGRCWRKCSTATCVFIDIQMTDAAAETCYRQAISVLYQQNQKHKDSCVLQQKLMEMPVLSTHISEENNADRTKSLCLSGFSQGACVRTGVCSCGLQCL